MRIALDIAALLQQAFEHRPPPRVRALHLPPVPWTGGKDGEFGALELESGALGLSYLLLDGTLARIGQLADAVRGADALQLLRWWADGGEDAASPARAALGFAAVNALSRECFDRAGFAPPAAPDSIGGLDPQPGESIGMVGYFPPLVKPVLDRGARLTVLELRPDLAGARDGFTVTLDPQGLAGCTQVLCTSTVLLNHSLQRVRAACRSAQRFVLVGPGAGCLPDALFDAGVTALAGTWIRDRERFVDAVARGAPWGGTGYKFLLSAADWPGWRRLAQTGRSGV